MNSVVLAARPWAQNLFDETLQYLPGEWTMVAVPHLLQYYIHGADRIFSLHWHDLIPAEIVERVHTIGFHASDLPQFRGGSPIRNQQKRGVLDTTLTAFRVTAGLDEGPICLQMPLSLRGTDEEIFDRISGLVARMMPRLLAGAYHERPQEGTPSVYTRADAT